MTFNQVDSYRRMRSATEFSDVTLACEDGRQIYAHRVILASSSRFFQEVLTKVMHSHPLIYLKGVPHAHLSAIVDLIYLGQAEVVQKDLTLFLEIGRELGVKGLTEQGKGGEVCKGVVASSPRGTWRAASGRSGGANLAHRERGVQVADMEG